MRARGRGAARWTAAAGAGLALATPALAQQAPPPPPGSGAEIDPSAPLDPMPDLGVAWPDLGQPDPVAEEPAALPDLAAEQAEEPLDEPILIEDGGAARQYRVALSGIDGIEAGADIRQAYDEQSTLIEAQGEGANAAQIDRRVRADVELLAELLRAQGYYDAEVEPDIDVANGAVAITLRAMPGQRYRFESVELPGLAAAGDEAVELREAFAVRAGDPVVAEKVIAAGTALVVALGEQGFATADVGEQDIVIDHERGTARLTLPVAPGPEGRFGAIRVSGAPPFSARHVGRIARFGTGDP